MKRAWIGTGVLLAALAAAFAIRFVPFEDDISVMLPKEKEISQALRFFREAPFTANVIVSFALKEGGDLKNLHAAVDRFAAEVKHPQIRRVIASADPAKSMKDMKDFLRLAPQLISPEDLKGLDAKLEAPAVREKLKSVYRMSLNPAGSMALPIVRQDPLGIHEKALKEFTTLLTGLDFDVRLENGHFVSRDGRHALVVLETKVPATDGSASRELLNSLRAQLRNLPEGVSADLISAHEHAVSNEKTIKRDILITTTVTGVVFLFLFIFVFRDPRALLLFFTPSVSVLISIPLCALIMGELSLIIMGMGAVISGIAVDYCIHVYIAMQSGQDRKAAVREIAKPVISGALTTAGAFAVFIFSGVAGYRQLAVFTVVSTSLSLALALLIFPHFLDSSVHGIGHRSRDFLRRFPVSLDRTVISAWVLVLVLCAAAAPSVRFSMDVKQYDGSEPAVFAAEERFHEVWGGRAKPAILAAEAPSYQQAVENEERLAAELPGLRGELTTLSGILPSEARRRENLNAWRSYWNGERAGRLRSLLSEEGKAFDFSPSAFEPFLNTLRPDEDLSALEKIGLVADVRRRFTYETPRGHQVVSYFPDKEEKVAEALRATDKIPGSFVVSAKRFESRLSQSTLHEAFWLSVAIAVILPFLAFLFLKNVRLVMISLIPVVTSILCILGMLSVFTMNLNVSSLIALMVVGGFSIDYGTFMIHQNEHDMKTNTYLGVTLSALTAFCGAGALVFAKHPVLFAYGASMVCGVLSGYLSAVFVVPAIYRLGRQAKPGSALREAA